MEKIRGRTLYILILLILAILTAFPSRSEGLDHSWKKLYQLGSAPSSLGRGGTGVTSDGADIFYYNPASAAGIERTGVHLNYGTLPYQTNYYDPGLSAAFPSSYGVAAISFRSLIIEDDDPVSRVYSGAIGGGKEITARLKFGAAFDFLYNSSFTYTGMRMGFIYRLEDLPFSRRTGLFEPKIGFAVNGGYARGDDYSSLDFTTVSIGYSFDFFSSYNLTLGLFNEVSAYERFREFPVKTGLEAVYKKKYVMRGGFIYPGYLDYGDINLGLGYRFSGGDFSGSLDYSVSHYRDKKFVHYAGLTLEYGELDSEPPLTIITPDNRYISPNSDGSQDFVIFKINVTDESRIKGWRLQVTDDERKTIRDYRISDREMLKKMSPVEFLKRLFRKRESAVVPENIIWDGKDMKGVTVPDKSYDYTFYAWDERDNISVVKKGKITVDNQSPAAKLSAEDLLFSPNGDGRKDTIKIKQEIKASPEDRWSAAFTDKEGKRVRSFSWRGDAVPTELQWDGKDDSGKELPEGLYTYFIKSRDMAGNSASGEIREISLTRRYEIADIKMSSPVFSFLRDKEISLFPYLSKKEGLVSWKIIVLNSSKKPVKVISGGSSIPALAKWDCIPPPTEAPYSLPFLISKCCTPSILR